jgi:hypothetical protein
MEGIAETKSTGTGSFILSVLADQANFDRIRKRPPKNTGSKT